MAELGGAPGMVARDQSDQGGISWYRGPNVDVERYASGIAQLDEHFALGGEVTIWRFLKSGARP